MQLITPLEVIGILVQQERRVLDEVYSVLSPIDNELNGPLSIAISVHNNVLQAIYSTLVQDEQHTLLQPRTTEQIASLVEDSDMQELAQLIRAIKPIVDSALTQLNGIVRLLNESEDKLESLKVAVQVVEQATSEAVAVTSAIVEGNQELQTLIEEATDGLGIDVEQTLVQLYQMESGDRFIEELPTTNEQLITQIDRLQEGVGEDELKSLMDQIVNPTQS